MEGKTKLTKLEKFWILYDVGNSAFTMLVSTIIPIYFNHLAGLKNISEVDYLAYWGYAASLATLLVAIIGPVLGTIADTEGYKKPIFTISMMVGVIGCAALSIPTNWLLFLAVFVIAKVAYNSSLIFYDAMLNDVTTPERMDDVSSRGYAWGYIGSCVPFIISLVIVLKAPLPMQVSMGIAFVLNALWWAGVTIPLLKNYKQINYAPKSEHPIRDSFSRLGHVFQDMKEHPNVFWFLLAFFFYIDGVYTIIEMATAFGSALGFSSTTLLLALLVTQFVAFPFALLFGRLSSRMPNGRLIRICIIAYTAIALFAIQLDKPWEFWLLAVCVGMFQGGIQALSRSYFSKIIPPEKSGEYFGVYDIFGKGAAFMGTMLVGAMAQITGSLNTGVSVIAAMFVVGIFLFGKALKMNRDV
ncbi:MAG: MFS transporter [Lachnospiraceae bacterium]|nr:MFS transporter [Lachnospiraceae bacterium]